MFRNKILLITGGTGSFGSVVLKRFLSSNLSEIRIFSRDEEKQNNMRKKYNNPKIKYFIGDIRDYQSVSSVVDGVDYIFHAAALKQVPSCEFFPMEAIKTNAIGTENLIDAAISANVKKVVCLSTDKAVYPINAMGMSKAIMEKIIHSKISKNSNTIITITRYGNVMGSRGSVIPLFIDQIKNKKSITITDPNMTRFMMSLDDAVKLVIYAFKNGKSGDIFVQKSPASTIENLSNAIKKLMNATSHKVKIIGTRQGEKKYEVLMSKEEVLKARDNGNYFCIPYQKNNLDYASYFNKGVKKMNKINEYSSHNTSRLNLTEMIKLLKKENFI
tara:strand:+ start:21051 stop:22040 length:990 start_codon:yes stop_codon:yes gene_type:complete